MSDWISSSAIIDGRSNFNIFGQSFGFSPGGYLGIVDPFEGQPGRDSVNLSLRGDDWFIRAMSLNGTSPIDVTIDDQPGGGGGRIEYLTLQEGTADINLSDSRILNIRANDNERLTLTLGAERTNSIVSDGEADITIGTGRVAHIGLDNGDDTITGGPGRIGFVEMEGGNNTFIGGAGRIDTLRMGDGDDTVTLRGAAETISLGGGINRFDWLTDDADAFIASLISYSGDNTVSLGSGNVRSIGFSGGRDEIVVGGTVEVMQVGGGDDRVIFLDGARGDSVNLGSGNNFLRLLDSQVWSAVSFGGDDFFTLGTGRMNQLYGGGGDNIVAVLAANVNSVVVNDGDDFVLVGSGSANVVQLGGGENSLRIGRGSVDAVTGYHGDDTLIVNSGNLGTATLGAGDNTVKTGREFVQSIIAFDGNDSVIVGRGGIGHLRLDNGANVVDGRGGFIEHFEGGADRDRITLGDDGGRFFNLGDGDDSLVLGTGGVRAVRGGDGTNLLDARAGGFVGTYEGGADADIVALGSEGADSLRLRDGNNRVTTEEGYVRAITADNGNDRVTIGDGGAGVISTRGGNDTVTLGASLARVVDLGEGDDRIVIGPARDDRGVQIGGGNGRDLIDLSGFDNDLTLDLRTSAYQDVADGEGFISLFGIEEVVLGDGDDRVVADNAENRFTGGAGADVFVFDGQSSDNIITDFVSGTDVVEIDAPGLDELADLTFADDGDDSVVSFGNVTIRVLDISVAQLEDAANFDF